MAFLLVVSIAALYQSAADRIEKAGRSIETDTSMGLVIPLARGMTATPVHVFASGRISTRTISVTLLDDRLGGASRFRVSKEPYEADATIAGDFARYRVLRIAGILDCGTGEVQWTNYEIAADSVTAPIRTAPPLRKTPPGLPSRLDMARTSLICEYDSAT